MLVSLQETPGSLPCPFLKTEVNCLNFAKRNALILEKSALCALG